MRLERIEAKLLAYSNAAEFIRGHGEEGGQRQEDYEVPLDLYFAEMEKLANRLDNEVKKIMLKYSIQ